MQKVLIQGLITIYLSSDSTQEQESSWILDDLETMQAQAEEVIVHWSRKEYASSFSAAWRDKTISVKLTHTASTNLNVTGQV